ncbi:MAG: hypothetical protein U1A77_02670 [Pirellulales bacterium]
MSTHALAASSRKPSALSLYARQHGHARSCRALRRLLFEPLEDRSLLAVFVWDGAPDVGGSSVDANWQSGSNWVGDVAPSAGVDLIFPTGISANLASTNDFAAGTNFGVIQLLGNNYQLGGNGITLAEGVSNSGSGNDLQLALTLGATQGITNNSELTLSGGVAIAGFDLTFAGNGTTQVNSAITGAGNLIQQNGTTVLAVANSYDGTTTVTGGTLRVLDAQALGVGDGTAATETILNGGSLVLGAGLTMPSGERLHATGPGDAYSYLTGEGAGSTWGGDVLLEAASGYSLYLDLQGTLTIQGAIVDAGSGVNQLSTNGSATLNDDVAVDYLSVGYYSSLFVNANTTVTTGFYGNYSSTITIANATLSTPSLYSYYSNLVLDHGVLSYTTLLYGYPMMTWSGHGTVQDGDTFLVQDVSPGRSAGQSGVLESSNISLYGSFTADLAGSTAGEGAGQHDQLQVHGTVQVGGNLAVNVAGVYTPPLNQEYVLIDNDGADAISGTFTGLSEGALLVVGTYVFQVSYQGGDGNDFSLTRIKANVWDGAPDGGGSSVDANWQTGCNWVGDVAPSAGDDLIFPTEISANQASTNDFAAGTNFGVIQLLGNNYQLGGNGITLAEGVSNSGSGNDLQLALTLGATQTILNNAELTLSGGVAIAGFDLTFAGNGTTQVNSAITGAGNLIQQNGTTVLAVANSYDGTTTVTGGTLRVLDAQALGVGDGTAATETILNGGSLVLGAGLTMPAGERLHATGPGDAYSYLTGEGAGSTWGGDVLLEAASGYSLYLDLQGTLTIQGAIVDAGSGVNQLSTNGSATLNDDVAVDYLSVGYYSSLFVNANTTVTTGFYGNYSSTITIANATLSTPSLYSYYSNLVLDHGVLSYTTLLYGYPMMTWSGHGTVQDGDTFLVQDVSPGRSAGQSGVLESNNVSLYGSFTADLAGSTAGEGAGQHDQLQVHGTVQVGGNLAVNVAGVYTPPLNQEYVLIDNDGADAISGTFTGLSEGALLIVGTYVFQVSYQGGDGNDFSLTRIKAAVWDGAPDVGGSSVDANWQSGSNWVGDVAPSAGVDLIFPTGISANLASTNDFAAGTNFGVIQLLGNNYQLGGNGITLAEGVSNSGSGNDLQLALTLGATQTILNNAELTLSGGVAIAGFDLTFAGNGTTQVNSAITGAGNLIQQNGTTVLAVANSYDGTTTVTGGTLRVLDGKPWALGTEPRRQRRF